MNLRRSLLAAAVLAGMLAAPCSQAANPSTVEVRVLVVDAATGAPIEGAVGIYSADVWEGTLTGRGSKTTYLFKVRAQSNSKGEMVFAPTPFADVRFGLFGWNTSYGGPAIAVGKSGYAAFNWSPRLYSKNLAEAVQWDNRGPVTIRLQPVR